MKEKEITKLIQLKKKINKIESTLARNYNEWKEKEESDMLNDIKENPQRLYAYMKGKKHAKTCIGPLLKKDGTLTSKKQEMANLLKEQYESVFSTPRTIVSNPPDNPNDPCEDNEDIFVPGS